MAGLSDIQHKIEMLMFNHMITDGHIIDDEGVFNVPVETGINVPIHVYMIHSNMASVRKWISRSSYF